MDREEEEEKSFKINQTQMHRWWTNYPDPTNDSSRTDMTILLILTLTTLSLHLYPRPAPLAPLARYFKSQFPTKGLMTVFPSLSFPLFISSNASLALSRGYL